MRHCRSDWMQDQNRRALQMVSHRHDFLHHKEGGAPERKEKLNWVWVQGQCVAVWTKVRYLPKIYLSSWKEGALVPTPAVLLERRFPVKNKKKVYQRGEKINDGAFIRCSLVVLWYLEVIRSEYLSSLFSRSFAMLILWAWCCLCFAVMCYISWTLQRGGGGCGGSGWGCLAGCVFKLVTQA